MTYLITGASGFIGRHLVDTLLAQGHAVNYLARQRSPRIDSRAAFYCWNSGEAPPLECIRNVEAIVHLAGEPVAQRWNEAVKERIRSSRVQGTRSLVSAIGKLRGKPQALISASAIGYYGSQGDEILTESAGPGQGFLAEVCVEWEREAQRARDFGVRVAPVRISHVLGGDGGALPKMAAPFRFGLGGKLGSGKQWMSWIHVRDLVRMLMFAAETPEATGALNGASPNPQRNEQFTRELAGVLKRPALFTAPRFALRMALGEIGDSVFESVRAVPETALAHGFRFEFPELGPALRDALRAC